MHSSGSVLLQVQDVYWIFIQQAMELVMQGRTSFVIAHRLSTVIGADQILVLDEGKLVERGRHDELLSMGGMYAQLYETQFRVEL